MNILDTCFGVPESVYPSPKCSGYRHVYKNYHSIDRRTKNVFDENGSCILKGHSYIDGKCLSFERVRKNMNFYKEMHNYQSNVVHPFNNYSKQGHLYHNTGPFRKGVRSHARAPTHAQKCLDV